MRTTGPLTTDAVSVLLLADVSAAARLWGWWRIARRAAGLAGIPGLLFGKTLGSGFEGGFGLRPSASRQGVFLVFDSETAADAFIRDAPLVGRYRARSDEVCIVKLRAWSSRGSWAGQALPASPPRPDGDAPVAALTRASIRTSRALRFWRRAPGTQTSLDSARGCRLAAGLGEAPLLRQATFSIWDNVAAMDAYARSGAHLEAIQAAQREQHFSESMFVRFTVLSIHGRWKGVTHG